MSLYEILCEISGRHEKILGGGYSDCLIFDLENCCIRSKNSFIIENGLPVKEELLLEKGEKYYFDYLLSDDEKKLSLQELYDNFIFSCPSKEMVKGHFRPKKSDELSFEELLHGENRNVARCKLEAFIVLGKSMKIFHWENPGHWFYKGNNGLIVYKQWVV